MEPLAGAGGWAYFDVPGEDRLRAYARAFPFVEVNSTFYRDPDPRTVVSWRRRVPESFSFSVRAHGDVTHRYRLHATPAARASLARTARFATLLRALAVVLETPASLRIARREAEGLRDLLGSLDLPCPVGLEARAYEGRALPRTLAAAMEDGDIADVVDFSRQSPRTTSSLAYGRLFGFGEGNRWEFTDDELRSARQRGDGTNAKRIVHTFHGVRMYKDAARFLTYARTGKFPRATRRTGPASLQEVLEDAKFPATKASLLRDHGWRVVDLTADRRVHADVLLADLPPGTYRSPAAVADRLAAKP